MIEIYRKYLDFSKKEFQTFFKVYKYHLNTYRPDNKFYLYSKEHLLTALSLSILLKDKIQDFKLFLTCLILNGYSSDVYNLNPLPNDEKFKLKSFLNSLYSTGLYTKREISIIDIILSYVPEDGIYLEDYQKDFYLFDDFRKFLKIVHLGDNIYIRHSENIDNIVTNRVADFPIGTYKDATESIKNSIRDEYLKELYQHRIFLCLEKFKLEG